MNNQLPLDLAMSALLRAVAGPRVGAALLVACSLAAPVAAEPGSPRVRAGAQIEAAIAALRAGEPERARAILEQLPAGEGETPRGLFYLGRAYLELGRPGEAVTTLGRAASLDERNPAVRYWHGVALARAGRIDEARAELQAVLMAAPDSIAARLQMAWLLLLEDRGQEARAELEALVEAQAESALGWHYLGLAREAVGEPGPARDAFARARALDPELAIATVGEARSALALGDREAGEQLLEALIEARTSAADAWYELGRLRLGTGRGDEATALLEHALTLDPGHEGARYQLGVAYLAAGRELEGRALLSSVAERARAERAAAAAGRGAAAASDAYRRGLDELARGEPSAAAESFRAALAAAGERATAAPFLGLGVACLEALDPDCARPALERAVELEPELAVGWLVLSRAHAVSGDSRAASAALARYRALVARR